MNSSNHILIGYAYQRCDELYPVNMQIKTSKKFVDQANAALKNDSRHVVKWIIKKKITLEQ